MRLVVTLVPELNCIEFLLVAPSISEFLPLGLYCSDLNDFTLASSALSLFSLFWLGLRLLSRALTRSLNCIFSFLKASLSSRNKATYRSNSAFRSAKESAPI